MTSRIPDQVIRELSHDYEISENYEDQDSSTLTKSKSDSIKIVDAINPMLKESCFKIKANERAKSPHQQSASYRLSKNATKLSSDRLYCVMQQTTPADRSRPSVSFSWLARFVSFRTSEANQYDLCICVVLLWHNFKYLKVFSNT